LNYHFKNQMHSHLSVKPRLNEQTCLSLIGLMSVRFFESRISLSLSSLFSHVSLSTPPPQVCVTSGLWWGTRVPLPGRNTLPSGPGAFYRSSLPVKLRLPRDVRIALLIRHTHTLHTKSLLCCRPEAVICISV